MPKNIAKEEAARKLLEKCLKDTFRGKPLDPAQWNFKPCPTDERDECFLWELARESEAIKADVEQLRRKANARTFDRLLATLGKEIFAVTNRRPMAVFYFCPEWPESPYLASAEANGRKRRIAKAWGSEEKARAYLLDARNGLIPSDIADRIQNARASKAPIYRIGSHELAMLAIEWMTPDSELKRNFAAWLQYNRPKEIKAWPDRGEGLPQRQRLHQLKQLGALRLLRHYRNWKNASGASQQVLRKPLYSEQGEWTEAEEEARKMIRQQESFHSSSRAGF